MLDQKNKLPYTPYIKIFPNSKVLYKSQAPSDLSIDKKSFLHSIKAGENMCSTYVQAKQDSTTRHHHTMVRHHTITHTHSPSILDTKLSSYHFKKENTCRGHLHKPLAEKHLNARPANPRSQRSKLFIHAPDLLGVPHVPGEPQTDFPRSASVQAHKRLGHAKS